MKTILLAEDNQGAAALYKVALEDEGYQVLLAEDGPQTIDDNDQEDNEREDPAGVTGSER